MTSNSNTTNNSIEHFDYKPDTFAGIKAHIRHVFESMKVCGVNATDVRALTEFGIPVIHLMMKNTQPEDLEQWCLDWAKDIFKNSEI